MSKVIEMNGSNPNLPQTKNPQTALPQNRIELTRSMVKRVRVGKNKFDRFVFERDGLKNILHPVAGLTKMDVDGYEGDSEIWIANELLGRARPSVYKLRKQLEKIQDGNILVLLQILPVKGAKGKHGARPNNEFMQNSGIVPYIEYPFNHKGLEYARKKRVIHMKTFDADAGTDMMLKTMQDAIIRVHGIDYVNDKLLPRLRRKFRRDEATISEIRNSPNFKFKDWLKYNLRLTKELPAQFLEKEYSELFFKLKCDVETQNDIMMSCISSCMYEAKDQKLGMKYIYQLFAQKMQLPQEKLDEILERIKLIEL